MTTLLAIGLGLIGAALVLVAIEVFIPSAGLIGFIAGIAAVAGVICLWRVSETWGLAGTLTVIVLGPALFFFLLNVLPSTPAGRRLIGAPPEEELAERDLAERQARVARASLVGAVGVALTDLRPIGTVEIDGQRYDALAETAAIDQGTRVRVTAATMLELKVRPAS